MAARSCFFFALAAPNRRGLRTVFLLLMMAALLGVAPFLHAQGSTSLMVYTDQNEPFKVLLEGEPAHEQPSTQVYLTGLSQAMYKLLVVDGRAPQKRLAGRLIFLEPGQMNVFVLEIDDRGGISYANWVGACQSCLPELPA